MSGIPALTLTLSSITPTAEDLLGNAGHPELSAFQVHLADGTADNLVYTFVPSFATDGSNVISFKFLSASLPPSPSSLSQTPDRLPLAGPPTQCVWAFYTRHADGL